MLGSPCNPCCGYPKCTACADEATQIVIEFSTGDGSGTMFEYDGVEYSIDCQPQDYTIVLDIGEACSGTSANEYCLGVVSADGTPRESNCMYWGGNERESYAFSYGLSPTGRTGTVIGGGAYRIFPEEAAWTFDRINWIGRTRVVGFSNYGFPFFSIIRSWSKQRYRLYRFRSRRPPAVDIQWNGGGTGAEFAANLSQHADGLGNPYWKIDSVSVVNGGSGYDPTVEMLTASLTNGTGALPSMRVTSMAYTPPSVTVSVAAPSATPAQLAVTLKQQGGFTVTANGPPFLVIPQYVIDSVAVTSGGEGYPPNQDFGINLGFISGSYPFNDNWYYYTPHAFRAFTNADGQVESVEHVPTNIAPGGTGGRGNLSPTASALAVTIAGTNEIVGLVGVDVTRTRAEPTVVAIPPASTKDMEMSVSLSKTGSGANAYWSVSSVAVTAAGSGWEDADPVTFAVQGGADAVAEVDAAAVLEVSRVQPNLTATTASGTGVTLAVTVASNGGNPETWGVSGITATGSGSGYSDYQAVAISGVNVTADSQAAAYIRTGREQPTIGVGIIGTGSGADFSVTISEVSDWSESSPSTAWTVSTITIEDGGAGYSVYDELSASTNGQQSPFSYFYAYVSEVDENGAITAVQMWDGGLFYKSNGQVQSVLVTEPGQYYGKQLDGVTITNAGKYYNQTFTDTSTPRGPLNCKQYPSGWDTIEFESPDAGESGNQSLRISPRVGEQYTFKDVFIQVYGDVYDFPEIGHVGTRVCEDPEITVTIQ